MELYNGRPENFTERLPKEQRVYELLDSLGIDYDPSTCSIPEPTLRILTAICGLLSPAAH